MAKPTSSTEAFEAARVRSASERYVLRLYVAGTTPGSTQAVEALREICDEHLLGRYDLEVIDVYQQPTLARDEQIIAVPTLVKKLPAPIRRILGDLADKQRVLISLDLKQKPEQRQPAQQKSDEKKRRTSKRA
jgi:circadian clock protein KaiB